MPAPPSFPTLSNTQTSKPSSSPWTKQLTGRGPACHRPAATWTQVTTSTSLRRYLLCQRDSLAILNGRIIRDELAPSCATPRRDKPLLTCCLLRAYLQPGLALSACGLCAATDTSLTFSDHVPLTITLSSPTITLAVILTECLQTAIATIRTSKHSKFLWWNEACAAATQLYCIECKHSSQAPDPAVSLQTTPAATRSCGVVNARISAFCVEH